MSKEITIEPLLEPREEIRALPARPRHHQVVVVGGGSAGLTVAARLRRALGGVDIAIVEPDLEGVVRQIVERGGLPS